MSKANTLRQEIADAEQLIIQLKANLEIAKADEFFTCGKCNKRTVVSKTSVIAKEYYTQPHGCSGGDYWSFCNYIIFCNKCNEPTHVNPNIDDAMYLFTIDHEDQFFELMCWHPSLEVSPRMTLEEIRREIKIEPDIY